MIWKFVTNRQHMSSFSTSSTHSKSNFVVRNVFALIKNEHSIYHQCQIWCNRHIKFSRKWIVENQKRNRKNQKDENNTTRKNVLRITSIQHVSIIFNEFATMIVFFMNEFVTMIVFFMNESVTTTYFLVNLLQWCISSEFVTMTWRQITRFRKNVFIDQKEKQIVNQIKKHIFVKFEKQSINRKRRIFAKNIDCFVILIDLIFRQNSFKIKKFEFVLFAS